MSDDVQPVTYGNIQDADGRRHGDGLVYANIQISPTSATDEPQYGNSEASQRVVYSELHAFDCI